MDFSMIWRVSINARRRRQLTPSTLPFPRLSGETARPAMPSVGLEQAEYAHFLTARSKAPRSTKQRTLKSQTMTLPRRIQRGRRPLSFSARPRHLRRRPPHRQSQSFLAMHRSCGVRVKSGTSGMSRHLRRRAATRPLVAFLDTSQHTTVAHTFTHIPGCKRHTSNSGSVVDAADAVCSLCARVRASSGGIFLQV